MGFTRVNLCEALFAGKSLTARGIAKLYCVSEDDVVAFYEALESRGLVVLKDPAKPRWELTAGIKTIDELVAAVRLSGVDVTEELGSLASITGVRVNPLAKETKRRR